MKFNIRLRILAIVAPIIPVLIAFFMLLQDAEQQSESLRTWIDRTYEVTRQINKLLTDMLDSEAGQRGFIITNDEVFLGMYSESIKKVDSDVTRLRELSVHQQQRELEELISKKTDEMVLTISIRKEQGLTAAADEVAKKTGKDLMDAIRLITTGMIEEENRQLTQRKNLFKQTADEQQKFELLAVQCLLLMYAFMTLMLMRSIMNPLDKLTNGSMALAKGDEGVRIKLARNDEFGALAQAFNRMADAIGARAQQLKNNEARLKTVIETAAEGIITISDKGIVETLNPAAEQIFGYQQDEVIGQNIKMLMPEPYQSRHDDYLADYLATGVAKIIGYGREVEGRNKDGTVFPMELFVSEMLIEDQRMFTGLVRNITERKEMERMKNEFISTVSHELRTPLTSIRGSLGLILGGATGELPEKSKQLLSIANNNCVRLVRLINDILDIEKLESGKMVFDLKPLEIMPLVRHTVDSNRAYADEFDVTYAITNGASGVFVLGDYDRLIQVLTNLLSNAAKFSHRGGQVDVAVSVINRQMRLSVTDYGSGIRDEFKNKIFSKFSQEDSSNTRQKGGTGLGLNISKAIVEKLGGQVGFDSVVNEYTCFYVDLPVWTETQAASEAVAPVDLHDQVLILEDDPDVANLLRLMLEKRGITADIAYNAEQAKQLLKDRQYYALTLDLMLPGQSGVDFFRELRGQEQFQNLPVIVVSVIADKGRKELNGDALSVIDWLDKPIDEIRLQQAVTRALRKNNRSSRILHIEDDPDIVHIVSTLLADSAVVDNATNLAMAKEKLSQDYDLVILDITLPDGSGLSLLPLLSQRGNIPVVIFSASEMDLSRLPQIIANLVKSKTTNEMLINKIESILKKQA